MVGSHFVSCVKTLKIGPELNRAFSFCFVASNTCTLIGGVKSMKQNQKIRYHMQMEKFWNNIESLSLKLPGKLYRIPFKFAESRWQYHNQKIDKILFNTDS